MPFIPHSQEDIAAMLKAININDTQTLFDEIPASLINELKHIPSGLNEMAMTRVMQAHAATDKRGLCFIGAGAYEHHIPAAVWDIATRGEFMTAYTPYQAEASQGTLQLLYEYQTMMASLMGMDVSNASMYEGASALAEAMLMAIRCQSRNQQNKTILVAGNIHPHYLQAARALISVQGIDIVTIPFDIKTGCIDATTLKTFTHYNAAALVIAQPNFFGQLEAVDVLTDWAHAHNMLVIAVVNPIAMALLKEPGSWGETGADIACGEGQPLGIPLASGGPYFGFLCTRKALIRQMPGRLIGRTVDVEGKPGFTLTLQAREQHIRRAKATSNICTNQGLAVTAATIFMSLLGEAGLRNIALVSYEKTQQLAALLILIPEVKLTFSGAHFHEIVITLPIPAAEVVENMAKQGIQAGYDLGLTFPELSHHLLICATETKTEEDLQEYVNKLRMVLKNNNSCVKNKETESYY